MFNQQPTCMQCKKEIKAEEVVYMKMRYPKSRGFTEIKAYLNNEAQFICEACFTNK